MERIVINVFHGKISTTLLSLIHPLNLFFTFLPLFLSFFLFFTSILYTDPRSLEGIVDKLRSDELVDGVATQNLTIGDSDDEHQKFNPLPGMHAITPCLV
jgi:hypothetical protein